MEKTIELDIENIFRILWRNVKWLILGLLLGAAALFMFTRFFLESKYTSSVSLYVNNNTDVSNGTPININDINASQKLVNTYVVILEHDEVLQRVANQLMEEYTDSELEEYVGLSQSNGRKVLKTDTLRGILKMGSVNNTEVLNIEAESKNAMFSARVCNLIAEIAPEVLQRVIKAGSVEVIGEAAPAFDPTSPNSRKNTAIGALLGLVLSAMIVLIRFLTDNTIKGEEDIKARFDVPVLGEIPDFETGAKGGGRLGK